MNKKVKNIVTGGFTAAILAIVAITAVLINLPSNKQHTTTAVQGAQASQQQGDDRVTFVATKGKNVLDQLKEHATVSTIDSQYGTSIDAINGMKQEGKYWNFYVDGQMSEAGAHNYVTQGGEKIEWKLE